MNLLRFIRAKEAYQAETAAAWARLVSAYSEIRRGAESRRRVARQEWRRSIIAAREAHRQSIGG